MIPGRGAYKRQPIGVSHLSLSLSLSLLSLFSLLFLPSSLSKSQLTYSQVGIIKIGSYSQHDKAHGENLGLHSVCCFRLCCFRWGLKAKLGILMPKARFVGTPFPNTTLVIIWSAMYSLRKLLQLVWQSGVPESLLPFTFVFNVLLLLLEGTL